MKVSLLDVPIPRVTLFFLSLIIAPFWFQLRSSLMHTAHLGGVTPVSVLQKVLARGGKHLA